MKRNFFLVCLTVFFSLGFSLQATEKENSLDGFLKVHGYHLSPLHSDINEGYCSRPQQEIFEATLKKYKGIKRILEIGFNAGHSCEIFLKNCPEASVTTIDLNEHPYTKVGVDFMKRTYPRRFEFVEGNSLVEIPAYTKKHPETKFDLIYIDGGHTFECSIGDLRNGRKVAKKGALVWIDDFNFWDIKKAIQLAVSEDLISIEDIHTVSDATGIRCWVVAKYK